MRSGSASQRREGMYSQTLRARAVVGLAAWACAALGCAAAIGPSIAHDERETFRASSFDFARLKGGGLSMLGVTSRVAPEGIRDDAAFVIDQAVANRFSRVTLVSRNDTVARARQAGMAADLQRLIKGYEERGAFDAGPSRPHRKRSEQDKRHHLHAEGPFIPPRRHEALQRVAGRLDQLGQGVGCGVLSQTFRSPLAYRLRSQS